MKRWLFSFPVFLAVVFGLGALLWYWDIPDSAIKIGGLLIALVFAVFYLRPDFVRVRDELNKKKK